MSSITWDVFKINNQFSEGIQLKFEDLCRLLFTNEFLSNNKRYKYLHANPNNPGLETEPILDETNKRKIGFQAKFFESKVNYDQINNSARKIVEHYSGKVDLVYLFCNKTLTSSSLEFAIKILQAENIQLELITDKEILNLVISKYPYLSTYFFGKFNLELDWFREHSKSIFEIMGDRYTADFNVETEYLDDLSLFVRDQRAVDYINLKKTSLKEKIKELENQYRFTNKQNKYIYEYLCVSRNAISELEDVNTETLDSAINWFEQINQRINDFKNKYIEKNVKSQNNGEGNNLDSNDKQIKEIQKLEEKINSLLPKYLKFSSHEQKLLQSKVLKIKGDAGTGKTQLLAFKTKELLDSNVPVLLLDASTFYTDEPIEKQIMNGISLDNNFADLIEALETIGEIQNRIIPIFIDALNETWNKRLWPTGLPFIIEKIKKNKMVRLVVSYRSEYETTVLPESLQNDNLNVTTIYHHGFDKNGLKAIEAFLNYYNIPFTPLDYLGDELSNPLFLSLYCKTYDGKNVSLPVLYERIIKDVNNNIYRANKKFSENGFIESDRVLEYFVKDLAEYFVKHNKKFITRKELLDLKFWDMYKLSPRLFINNLIRESILNESQINGNEIIYFSFDQMNDYYCAKVIFNMVGSKEKVKKYLTDNVLGVHNSKLDNFENVDLFINSCALYAENYDEECIDIIDCLEKDYDQKIVFERYISSFHWRDYKNISAESFVNMIKKYQCNLDIVWSVLIGNSTKVSHPLNAEFLHRFLKGYKLNQRDSLWTIYINKITAEKENRLIQLIEFYGQGSELKVKYKEQNELVLTLFSWLLTSSNRWLRDNVSKAMIEILKNHFDLCLIILKKFDDANDPYVIQRLYGIVFGACCKKNCEGNYQALAEYVYENIFNKEKIYPDILLRDYARLIIENFLYNNPNYQGCIDKNKIIPPYKSENIQKIKNRHYLDKEYDGGILCLIHSMHFENQGMYGDFGRYVFQSALNCFDIDEKEVFDYAINFILNELGYTNKLFEDIDKQYQYHNYDRHNNIKTERIGKKYQWIAMYNILARISDHCEMVGMWKEQNVDIKFKGPWDPFIRDFDPTLNESFLSCKDAPYFNELSEFIKKSKEDNLNSNVSDIKENKFWLSDCGYFFKNINKSLILTDGNNVEWICLTRYCDTGRKNLNFKKLLVWSWQYAYFVTEEQAKEFQENFQSDRSVLTNDTSSHHEIYSVFNREYPWAPSYQDLKQYAWVDVQLKTGEYRTETIQVSDFSSFKRDEHIPENAEDENEKIFSGTQKVISEERQVEISQSIGKILHATTDIIWEGEYDGSIEDTISYSAPCYKIIEVMNLKQLESDGFFYTADGELAAFDTDLTQKVNNVVIRKDILDEFLDKTKMKLIWLVKGSKEIHQENNYSVTKWSDWEGLFKYNGNTIDGKMKMINISDGDSHD